MRNRAPWHWAGEIAAKDRKRLFILGLTGLFGNQVLFILGMQRTSPFTAAVVSQTQPVFSAVLATLAGLEVFHWSTALGVACAVVGATITVGVSGMSASAGEGVGLLLAGDLSMAAYFIVQKPLLTSGRLPPLTVTAYAYCFGAAQLLLMIACTMPWRASADARGVGIWRVRHQTVVALCFSVVMNSCFKQVGPPPPRRSSSPVTMGWSGGKRTGPGWGWGRF